MGDTMRKSFKPFITLHIILLLYSACFIFSKLAAAETFLSTQFIIFYGLVVGLLGIYAIAWQQIIKRLPLTVAYANKAVTIIWGTMWGALFFHETITAGKVIGAILIMAGIVIYSHAEGEQHE